MNYVNEFFCQTNKVIPVIIPISEARNPEASAFEYFPKVIE